MNERDILTEKKYAKEEGLAIGLAKGREEGREEGVKKENLRIALNLKNAGADITMISQATGLSIEQIDALK